MRHIFAGGKGWIWPLGVATREGEGGRGVRTFGDLEPGGHGGRELPDPRRWRSATASELDELAGVRSPAAAVGFKVSHCRYGW